MRSSRVVIKLGGAALRDESVLDVVTEALRQYRKYEYQVILVHGGGPAINAELTRRGIGWSFVRGQRVTTPDMMDVIESTLCGNINRKLVRHFGARGLSAVGFSGADGQLLMCHQAAEELGCVGEVETVNGKWLEGLLKLPSSILPVIAPVGVGANGESFNVNADWAASRLAVALKAKYLIFLTDQKGIWDADGKVMPKIPGRVLRGLVDDEVVRDGMLTKTMSVLSALDGGVSAVRIMDARSSIDGLWSNQVGTWCVPDPKPRALRVADAGSLRGKKEVSRHAV